MHRLIAIATAALFLASWTSAEPIKTIKEGVRVALVTERNGPHLGIYLSSLAASEGISSVAICDTSGHEFERAQNSLGSKHGKVLTFRNPEMLNAKFRPHFTLVALPAHLSPPAIRKALEAGSHVLSEKPGCVNAEQFEDLVKLAKEKKKNLMLSLPSRLSPRVLRAREIVKEGLLGKLYSVSVLQVKDQARLTRPDYQKSWYTDRSKSGGGHLIWLGIHQMDQVHFITGEHASEVAALTGNVGGQPIKIEDAEAVSMRFPSGMIGTFHGGYLVPGGSMQSGITIWGSKGWLRMSSRRGPDGTFSEFQWHSSHEKAPKGVQNEDPKGGASGYQGFIQAAIKAAAGTGPVHLTGEESLAVLKVIFSAYQSSETGKTVKVKSR